MNSKLSKFSPRTNAIIAGATLLAVMFTQNVSAGTVNPEILYENHPLERATFFMFFIGYISMGAAFIFFMSERNNVAPEYRTTMTISALIVGIAAFHYYYMRGVYVDSCMDGIEACVVSTDYRYMDWIITVPLMALKFPSLVGKDAITDNKVLGLGFTGVCFVGAIIMIAFGYLGEIGEINAMLGLVLGGVGWAMIMVATGLPFGLYDGKGVDNSKIKDELVWSANALRTFILVGWIIYPIGYLVGTDIVDAGSDGKEIMAILYNIADMVNKIGFGVVAWMGAKKASAMMS
uniref:Proteorhodopsin / Bacteriorhodopsin n=1 Tax=uncultured Poseidoniia archaeon TaxID=1697135 RepID=A0A1B1TCK5_9ARCH|nr:proteorhodopsin / Bacteriorhodopsin [uncultured Candidatus Thalassoarchaea sp.]